MLVEIEYAAVEPAVFEGAEHGVFGLNLDLVPESFLGGVPASDAEDAEALAFVHLLDQERLTRRRRLLRRLLAVLLDCAGAELEIGRQAGGRPVLSGKCSASHLDFSCSRRGPIWICAWSRRSRLGCDLEQQCAEFEDRRLVASYLTEREKVLLRGLLAANYRAAAAAAWTAKEAWLKMTGCGLLADPANLELLCEWRSPERTWRCLRPVEYLPEWFCARCGNCFVGALASPEPLNPFNFYWLN
jgi:phosphopantetheinyl transferase